MAKEFDVTCLGTGVTNTVIAESKYQAVLQLAGGNIVKWVWMNQSGDSWWESETGGRYVAIG